MVLPYTTNINRSVHFRTGWYCWCNTSVRNLKENTSCLLQVQGLPAAAGKRQGSDARRRSYCWWYCSLVLVLLWSVWLHARTHNHPLWRGVYVEGHSRLLRRPWLSTLAQRRRRLQQTNATSQIIQRGDTAPPALCAGPPSATSIAPASELHKRSRSVSRASQLSAAHVTRLCGGATSSLAPPITVA